MERREPYNVMLKREKDNKFVTAVKEKSKVISLYIKKSLHYISFSLFPSSTFKKIFMYFHVHV